MAFVSLHDLVPVYSFVFALSATTTLAFLMTLLLALLLLLQRYELETHLLHNLSTYLVFSSQLMCHFLREPPINRLSEYTTRFLHDLLSDYTSLCDDLVGVSSTIPMKFYEAERVSVLLTNTSLVLSTESGTQ